MDRLQRNVAGIAGILFVVLFVAGIIPGGSQPDLNASAASITQYYQDHHEGVLWSHLLITLASVAILWFVGGLSAVLSRRDPGGLLAPVVLGAGAVTGGVGGVDQRGR